MKEPNTFQQLSFFLKEDTNTAAALGKLPPQFYPLAERIVLILIW
jgi:hypothetical protein